MKHSKFPQLFFRFIGASLLATTIFLHPGYVALEQYLLLVRAAFIPGYFALEHFLAGYSELQ